MPSVNGFTELPASLISELCCHVGINFKLVGFELYIYIYRYTYIYIYAHIYINTKICLVVKLAPPMQMLATPLVGMLDM